MGFKRFLIFLNVLAVIIPASHAQNCQMTNLAEWQWLTSQSESIQDVFRGEFVSEETTGITGIQGTSFVEGLNGGPYFNLAVVGSKFSISTANAFANYEEYETLTSISLTVTFNCLNGDTRPLVYIITIDDTNNNAPLFRPSDEYEFVVMPPLPPGFTITGCLNDIIVRDIDLTTQRIDFEIFGSPYFEVVYEGRSTVPKEFKAALRTTTFIRTLPETLEFRISATDVDLTNDPPLTTYATVRIQNNDQFQIPEEMVFSRTFYIATYTDQHKVVLEDTITLRQGFHENVSFSLDPEYTQYFALSGTGNEVLIDVTTQLPAEVLELQQILLVVKAEREHTSGASATVVLQLPEDEALKFQHPSYEGSIVDNILQLPVLILSQGYEENPVTVEIISDHTAYFSYTRQQNTITLAMSPLPENILQQNNFLNLQVVASTGRTSASTIVTLEIVKDDGVTPVFEQALYEGSYNPIDGGLQLEQIVLVQGYDATVEISLDGDHKQYFQLIRDGMNTTVVTAAPLPMELFSEPNLFLTIEATKPRTVGATSVISVALPAETPLEFEKQNYKGVIEDNVLRLAQLTLGQGFENDPVSVHIQSGSAHSSYFSAAIEQNLITISMLPLPANIILENTFLNLQVIASTDRSSASAIVTLEIIKNDKITPVFERSIYEGTYDPVGELTLGDIVLAQGYDETVEISLQGVHSTLFGLVRDGAVTRLTVSSLPQELFREQNLLLTIQATKPRTVGGNAAISIALPTDRLLGFASLSYSGTIQNGQLNLGTIVLDTGYTEDVDFALSGEFSSYFNIDNTQNEVRLELGSQLPDIAIANNRFLLLTLSASALNAVTTSTAILLDIITPDTTTPQFNQDLFFGAMLEPSSIDIGRIYLTQGYDSSVTFRLDGVHSQYFAISDTENNIALTLRSTIPDEVIFDYKVLTFSILAEKELTVGAAAAISIRFPPELTDPTPLRFSKNLYTGLFENDVFTLEHIILEDGHASGIDMGYSLTGEFHSYFTLIPTSDGVTVEWIGVPIPGILERQFIKLELIADRIRAVPVTTVIFIEVVQPEAIIQPVFSEAYYRGVYTEETGLQFVEEISLYEGFHETVLFSLTGEFSQLFDIVQDGNSLTIITRNALPENVLENHNHLLFTIVAQKPGASDGRAAILIDLPKELPLPLVLSFTQASYVGQIEDGSLNLPPVALAKGYDVALTLSLTGEFASHFTVTLQSNIISVVKNTALPPEAINENAFIVLDLVASYPTAVSGYTTIIFELVKKPETQIVTPVFEQAYYMGQYSMESGLLFPHTIQLAQGFDESVSFTLAGDDSEPFSLVSTGQNSFNLSVNETMIENMQDRRKFVFSVVAANAEVFPASAAIIIALTDLVPSQSPRFAQDYYTGTIDNGHLSLNAIILEEGYTSEIEYNLIGDFVTYFQLTQQNGIFTLQLTSLMTDDIIQNNNNIIFTLAVKLENRRTHTTIILNLKQNVDGVTEPQFENPYYVGSYTKESGLIFNEIIRIDQGYDELLAFKLEGESSQWFALTRNVDSVTLRLDSPIPPAVVANNQQLLFTISAQRPGGSAARATIVILLNDEVTPDQVLGFDRIHYVGSIVDDTANLDPITLNEGFSSDVAFTLHGGLASYFVLNEQGATVNLALRTPIPQESLPANRLVILEIQASAPQSLSAFATIVLEVSVDDDTSPALSDPIFAKTFYVGSYTSNDGLVFDTSITLTDDFDDSVVFALEGVNSQWFAITRNVNSVTLRLDSPIPPAVVANNQQLLFTISAQRPGGSAARAAIVILLNDEVTPDQVLGFDRIHYVGSIVDDTANLDPITLNEGFSSDVAFTLHGGLASYFVLNEQGATVNLALRTPIPQESLPANRLVILEIQASAPQSLSAFATIVLEVSVDDDTSPALPDPIFAKTFYVGSYTSNDGLVFDTSITLTDDFDDSVVFALEGVNSQWFAITRNVNSVTLRLDSPIPPAVVANNQQLLFTISAQRPGGSAARAAIVILLNDEVTPDQVLGFDRIHYVGSIVDDTANLDPITLNEGFSSDVAFTLHGGLASYFVLNEQGATVNLALRTPIPQESLPANRLVILEIQASAPQSLSAFATIVLEVSVDDDTSPALPDPIFAKTFYVGSYTSNDGLVFDTSITLTDDFDDSVVFALEGVNSQWFAITRNVNSVTLRLDSPIPPAVVANNQQLLFTISAQRPGGSAARAAIVILLNDEVTPDQVLGFDRIHYVGSIVDDTANLDPITLNEGFSSDVAFTLHGGLASYFVLNEQGATVNLALRTPIPQESLPANRLVILEIQASAPQSLSAFATIVLEVSVDDDTSPALPDPIFAKTFYVGSYTSNDGLVFDTSITLTDDFDDSIVFALEGVNSQWFAITRNVNSVTLRLDSPIPPAVVANNQQLLFTISAQRPGGSAARATIVILLNDEVTPDQVLGFERIHYVGSIVDDTANLDPITLNEGFSSDVAFTLHGGLASYFVLNEQGATVNLALRTPIPQESLPANRLVILEIQASAPQSLSAFATIVLEVSVDDDTSPALPDPIFAKTFYVGSYTSNDGLVFDSSITLTDDFDDSVVFALEGVNSQWFAITRNVNSVTLRLDSPIPPAVVANNQQLLFTISAQRPGGSAARAAIVILLNDEVTPDQVLGFDRIHYVGSIVDDTANLDPITLNEGFSSDVAFTLHGGLASYFVLDEQGATVNLALRTPIPQESLPPNRLVILEIQASAPQSLSAFATIVLEVSVDDDTSPALPDPIFAKTFYVGSYTSNDGLVFDTSITLTDDFDDSVVFALEGVNSQWFAITRNVNSVTLRLDSPIPPAVVANNQQLLFTISAQRPGGSAARATIVILLNDEVTPDQVLGFDRIHYVGSIVDDTANLDPITLNEGFLSDVAFTLHGGLASYFVLNEQGATVNLALRTPIPQESLPANRLVILEIQASAPQSLSAFATIVLEVSVDDDTSPALPDPIFAKTFYVGSYTSNDGLVFNTSITLTDDFDDSVVFALEGVNSQWFAITRNVNSVTLRLDSPIPPAVVANNQQLLFTISAQRPGGSAARATIVILLNDEVTPDQVLGFDRIHYVGSIVDDTANLDPITLNEGFSSDVAFTLHGGLASYFVLNEQGATVNLALRTPIPQESLPANRLVILEIQASAPQSLSAFATIVLEVSVDDDTSPALPDPIFAKTFYVGSYTSNDGLVFDTSITLTDDFDDSVVFALEGVNSQWFAITRNVNSVTLRLDSPIPPAVVANNQQLLFTISAQRPGGSAARATIVILLNDEVTPDQVLGFDRIHYVGSIVDDTANLDPITLKEGFSSDVAFTLHGGLASYFVLNEQGATVNLALRTPIPQESLPANRLVILEIQASAPQSLSAFATIVLEVSVDDDTSPALPDPIFAKTFYVGSYTSNDGLVFDTSITLTDDFDDSVVFALEGVNSQWFAITRNVNSVTLRLDSPIPPAVVANNQQLLFTISAQRPGGSAARATIVILLNDEVTPDQVLGFDRIHYVGSIVDDTANLDPITLNEGFSSDVAFTLHGGLASYFVLNEQSATVNLALRTPIPQESLPPNRLVILEIQASAPQSLSAFATIVLEIIANDDASPSLPDPIFAETFYVGSFTSNGGLVFDSSITLTDDFDDSVVFALEGVNSQWFAITRNVNSVTLRLDSPIPPAVVANNQQLLFTISAQRPGGSAARATIVILLNDEVTPDQVLGFDRINYVGSIVDDTANLDPITLNEGFSSDVAFTLHGGLASYFVLNDQDATVTLALRTPIPHESLPANRFILLEIQASAPQVLSAFATIVFEVVQDYPIISPNNDVLAFDETYYVGNYSPEDGLTFNTPIVVTKGFDEHVEFLLSGEHVEWFHIEVTEENLLNLKLSRPIPSDVIADQLKFVFVLSAERPGSNSARATIIIVLEQAVQNDSSVAFDQVLYEGIIQGGVVQHDVILLIGYDGNNINIIGAYSTLFSTSRSGTSVLVQAAGPLTLPGDLRHVVLELRVLDAASVLILDVAAIDGPTLPTVSFESTSYMIRIEIGQTGIVGRVEASSDSGEAVGYSLLVDNEHLRTRISINSNGELLLSAPANSGVYTFQVVATTVSTAATAFAQVHLSVDAVTDPLIILDRDEEEPHRNLVLLSAEQEGCSYTLINRWPADQEWLYVDNTGLHAYVIDREDPVIAFMTVSQIQVELILDCGDTVSRNKRSVDKELNWLGPYAYGTNSWILADTIRYNPRRSIVNLVVNDINDNTPIFIGKESEPMIVGYPIPELEETVLPRSLAELQATDTDIGENAALVYWSTESALAVSPNTGFVHVRNEQQLAHDQLLTVNVTDLNGAGNTGSITLMVKLLDSSHIAVITVRDAFLEDEGRILRNISNVIGYEIRSLRSVVISETEEEPVTRTSRVQRAGSETGASLEVYVYGMTQNELVDVETIANDINSATVITVNIASILSLEDHLEGLQICSNPGRDTGLLVATIVLSVLLFILIVAIIVWFFLTRKTRKNYDEFSDANSIASQNESPSPPAKPEAIAVPVTKPRLNIEELKRSEKRLQDMLNAPIEDVLVEPNTSTNVSTFNSAPSIPLPDPIVPIVIQDKLKAAADESDDDEFGEVKRTPRKSVVTFNENVEKIIHVDETPDTQGPEFEVYKL